jgi:hypothetical protein
MKYKGHLIPENWHQSSPTGLVIVRDSSFAHWMAIANLSDERQLTLMNA